MVRLSRVSVVHLMLVLFAAALLAQAAKVQLVQGSMWAERARRQQFANAPVPAPRGNIYDGSNNLLAQSREFVRLAVAPREVRDRTALARALRRIGVGPAWVSRATDTSRKWVELPGDFAPHDAADVVSIPGVHPRQVMSRVYATTPGLQQLVGLTDASGRGAQGIELVFDSLLAGDSTTRRVALDPRGVGIETPGIAASIAATPGADITLTINRNLQEISERALVRATDSLRASGGDIVVMNPHTGEVLAMASRRGNAYPSGIPAVTESFEPGSTMKPFIAAALLEHRRAAPHESVPTNGGKLKVRGRTITDVHKSERLSLAEVIHFSSNVGIVLFAGRLTPAERFEMLRNFGLGAPTGVPLPSEAEGTLREPAKWSGTSGASIVMGYEVAVTPLQLVAAYGAIANGGELVQPHVVKAIRSPDGEILYRAQPRVIRRVLSPRVAKQVQEMLLGVVQGGTAVSADLQAYRMGGKSGTARRAEPGKGYVPGNYTASFVGLFPGDKPQYVVLVKLDNPRGTYYGGEIAAPVTKVVMQAALAARDAALDRAGLPEAKMKPDPDSVTRRERSRNSKRREEIPAAPAVIAVSDIPPARSVSYALPVRTTAPTPRAAPRIVPAVAGLPVREAVRRLHEQGLKVRLVAATTGSTFPSAGAVVPAGSAVILYHVP